MTEVGEAPEFSFASATNERTRHIHGSPQGADRKFLVGAEELEPPTFAL